MSWGLALSGGAAYGLANAGIVRVLHREGLQPGCISGSSMGAIIGGLYALHANPEPLEALMNNISLWNIARMSDAPLKDGLLQSGLLRQRLEEHLATMAGDACIGDCKIPFVCIAAKVKEPIAWSHILLPGFTEELLQRVQLHVFPPETRLLDALLATSAIPVLFSPVSIGGETFIDLMHFGAIPARTLRATHHPAIIIGTNTVPNHAALKQYLPQGWSDFLTYGYKELEQSLHACDLVITPRLTSSPFRFDKAAAFGEAGQSAAEEILTKIQTILKTS